MCELELEFKGGVPRACALFLGILNRLPMSTSGRCTAAHIRARIPEPPAHSEPPGHLNVSTGPRKPGGTCGPPVI